MRGQARNSVKRDPGVCLNNRYYSFFSLQWVDYKVHGAF